MLIAKGYAVSFDLADGGSVDAPARAAMLHDPTGKVWKRSSLLVGSFRRLGQPAESSGQSKDYFGRSYSARLGEIVLPPRELGAWTPLGDVETIWYTRPGKKARGRFRHEFNRAGLARLVKGRGKARLFRHGAFLRLELPRGAIVDGRGLVWP